MNQAIILFFFLLLFGCSMSTTEDVLVKNVIIQNEKDGIYPLIHRFAIPQDYRGDVNWELLNTAYAVNIKHFKTCSIFEDDFGSIVISISLDSEGARQLAGISKVQNNRPSAIVLKSQVVAMPIFYEPITEGELQISFGREEEAKELFKLLTER